MPLIPPSIVKKLTFEEFEKLPFTYRTGMRTSKGAQRAYRNDEHRLQKEVITKFNPRTQTWASGKVYYYLDGDPAEYKTVEEYYAAYIRRFDAEEIRKAMRCAAQSQEA